MLLFAVASRCRQTIVPLLRKTRHEGEDGGVVRIISKQPSATMCRREERLTLVG